MKSDEHVVHGNLSLAPESLLCIEDGREMVVQVRSGCVWSTQERDRRDVTLKAGEQFHITHRGCTLINAVRGSVIALTSPYQKCCARRIDLVHTDALQPLPIYRPE